MTPAPMGIARRPGVAFFVSAALPLLVFAVLESIRPLPFATSNDNWGYFLPLVDWHTNVWLSGARPKLWWALGQGWNPWESGQAGVLYPGYVVAAAISRLLGDRLALLDVSAALHWSLLGLVSYGVLPRRFRGIDRLLCAQLWTLAPGAIVIGMNWHCYLAPAPWFAGMLGLVWRHVESEDPCGRGSRAGLLGLSLLFFLSAHVQMYVVGLLFLALFALAAGRVRSAVPVVTHLALCGLAVLPALVFLSNAAAHAAPTWAATRDHPWLLRLSGDPLGVLWASMGGGLLSSELFAPAYFNPLTFAALAFALVRKRWRIAAAVLVVAVLIAPRTLPLVEHLALGPFRGFRWPVKLGVYATPMVAALFWVLGSKRLSRALSLAAILGSVVVIVQGHGAPTLRGFHTMGARGLAQAARACIEELALEPKARVAFVGSFEHSLSFSRLPAALVGMANNAAPLVGLTSAHLYEPLEPSSAANRHSNLTAFWRRSVRPERLADWRVTKKLADAGVQVLVAPSARDLAKLGPTADVRTCSGGMATARLPGAVEAAFPWQEVPTRRRALDVRLDGTLFAEGDERPEVPVARDLAWRRLDGGRWRGVPRGPGLAWIVASIASLMAAAALLVVPRGIEPAKRG